MGFAFFTFYEKIEQFTLIQRDINGGRPASALDHSVASRTVSEDTQVREKYSSMAVHRS